MIEERQRAYWRASLTYIILLLAVWFGVSFLCGIVFADTLDSIAHLGGQPLGFWFATQGSELTFVGLVFIYVALMNRLDRRFGVYER